MPASYSNLQPWERQPGESAVAYAGFRVYLELGPTRTLIAVARQLEKNRSLIYRWGERHSWRDRAYLWDRAQARETEAALAQEREAALGRPLQDASRVQRLSMAKISSLVIRDPESGEPVLSPNVTVADAIRLYRLGLEIQRLQLPSTAPGGAAATDQSLEELSDPEVQQVIRLAREHAETEQSQEAHEDEQQTKTNAEEDDPD